MADRSPHSANHRSASASPYVKALADLDSVAHAGNADAASAPVLALERFREVEKELFTNIPDHYLVQSKRARASTKDVQSVIAARGLTKLSGERSASPKKSAGSKIHVGASITDISRPIATTWKPGMPHPSNHMSVASRYQALFSQNSPDTPTPPEVIPRGDRRKELDQKRQERLSKFIPPAKAGVGKAALQPLPPKPTKKVPSVFVPSCATLTMEEDTRRQIVERAREEENRKQVGEVPFR